MVRVTMALDQVKQWLADHPKVLTFLFVGLIWFSKATDTGIKGAGGGYAGP